jgi:cobalt-zinc-cadmium efflux system protein
VQEVGRAMAAVPGVREVHDLHVWTVTSGFPALAAHVLAAPDDDLDEVRTRVEALLHERFEIDHTTLQMMAERLLTLEDRRGG